MRGTYGEFKVTSTGRGVKKSELFYKDALSRMFVQSSSVREAVFYRSVKHANIAECHSITVDDPNMFIELEKGDASLDRYAINASLSKRVQNFHRIFVGIAHGLKFLHNSGIAHGDLTPRNIVVLPKYATKLIDFGAVQFRTNHKFPQGLTTYNYCSPEDALHAVYGPTNDMYALGRVMMFYFMQNYGHIYVDRTDIVDWFTDNIEVDLSHIVAPKFIRNIMKKLLVFDHHQRMTAAQLIETLDPIKKYTSQGEIMRPPVRTMLAPISHKVQPLVQAYLAELQILAPQIAMDDTTVECCKAIANMVTDPMCAEFIVTQQGCDLFIKIFETLSFRFWI